MEKSENSWLKVGPTGSGPVSVDTHLAVRTPPRVEKSEKSWLKVGPTESGPVSVDTHLAGSNTTLEMVPMKWSSVLGPGRVTGQEK